MSDLPAILIPVEENIWCLLDTNLSRGKEDDDDGYQAFGTFWRPWWSSLNPSSPSEASTASATENEEKAMVSFWETPTPKEKHWQRY